MIVEGLLTTRNADGSINIAPQGPIVAPDFVTLTFRPFPPSATYHNLKRSGEAVFHIVDDVLLIVRTALHLEFDPPALHPAERVAGSVLRDCCRWYECRVEKIDESGERPVFETRVVHAGRVRDMLGFNRAKHAVIEATIAATRLHLLGREAVVAELERLRSPVLKTGDAVEREAFELVEQYVTRSD